MTLTVTNSNDALVVKPMGPRIDSMATLDFKSRMRHIIDESNGTIVLNMQEIEFIDSTGLGAIVSLAKHMKSPRALELTDLRPMVAKVFQLTQMDKVFKIHGYIDDPIRA